VILYHPKLALELASFGIDVPLRDDRARRAARAFQVEPFLESELEPLTKDELLLVHEQSFVDSLFDERLLYLLRQTYERPLESLSFNEAERLRDTIFFHARATTLAMKKALTHDWCYLLGGGMHHARKSRGSGYCLISDLIVGVEKLKVSGLIERVWIIDTDAHKGDGTAELAQSRDWIGTFSIHMGEGWPLDSDDPSLKDFPSTVDIAIGVGEEAVYHSRLHKGLSELERLHPRADFVVVISGADPYEHDELPGTQGLKLTLEQLAMRDQLIIDFIQARQLKHTWLLAGGYGERAHEVVTQTLKLLQASSKGSTIS
jgi:acetoin utilization deacetylase AcuC-like enzyme